VTVLSATYLNRNEQGMPKPGRGSFSTTGLLGASAFYGVVVLSVKVSVFA
jgi:hypothetical protein